MVCTMAYVCSQDASRSAASAGRKPSLKILSPQRRKQVVPLPVRQPGEPAEVIQPHILGNDILPPDPQHLGKGLKQVHRLIAHVDDLPVPREHPLQRHRYDGRRVGIVQDPRVARVFPRIPNDLNHIRDRPQAIGKAAGAAGFLAYHAMRQRICSSSIRISKPPLRI